MSIARTESYIGKPYNFIGSVKTDLILETIGKVYIKRLNLMLPIESVIEKVIATKKEKTLSTVIILEEGLDIPLDPYPGDGVFIYDPFKNVLYLTYDNNYNVIVNNGELEIYVKLTGDTMTGLLLIELEDPTLPPFVVNTQVVVENLNADMLDGKHSEDFLNKEDDYEINGNWLFNLSVKFNLPISSKNYNLNCNTNGWYLDLQGNLTVKNLTVKGELRECNKPEEEDTPAQLFTDEYVTKGLCGDYWVDIQFKLERIDWVEPLEYTGDLPTDGIAEIDGEDIPIKLHGTTSDLQTKVLVNGYDGFYCIVYLSELAGSNISMISMGDTFKSYIRGTEVNYYSFVVTNIIKDEDYIEYIVAKTSYKNKLVYGTKITNCASELETTITHDKYSADISDYTDTSEEEETNGYVVADPTDDTLVVRTGSKYLGTSNSINISTIHDDGPSISMYKRTLDTPRVTSNNLTSSLQSLVEENTMFKMGKLSNLVNQFTSFSMPRQGTFINPLVAVGTFLTSSLDVGYLLTNGTIKHFEASHPECGDMKINERGILLTSDGKLESAISTDVPFGPNIKNYINLMIDEKIKNTNPYFNLATGTILNNNTVLASSTYYTVDVNCQRNNSDQSAAYRLVFGELPNLSTLDQLTFQGASSYTFLSKQYIYIQEIRNSPSSENNNKIIPNSMSGNGFKYMTAQCAAFFLAICI